MSIMTYNGGTILAMAGNECVCIASDLRLGEQMTTVATNMKKVARIIFHFCICFVAMSSSR